MIILNMQLYSIYVLLRRHCVYLIIFFHLDFMMLSSKIGSSFAFEFFREMLQYKIRTPEAKHRYRNPAQRDKNSKGLNG